MTTIADCVFGDEGAEIGNSESSVIITPHGAIIDRGKVTVSVCGSQRRYGDFAYVTSRMSSKGTGTEWCMRVGVLRTTANWIVLLGVQYVLPVHLASDQPSPAIKLNRSEADDQGFYREAAYEVTDGILLEYEGGLMLLEKAQLVWHQPKRWNESVTSIDSSVIVLTDNSETGAAAIRTLRLSTGRA